MLNVAVTAPTLPPVRLTAIVGVVLASAWVKVAALNSMRPAAGSGPGPGTQGAGSATGSTGSTNGNGVAIGVSPVVVTVVPPMVTGSRSQVLTAVSNSASCPLTAPAARL